MWWIILSGVICGAVGSVLAGPPGTLSQAAAARLSARTVSLLRYMVLLRWLILGEMSLSSYCPILLHEVSAFGLLVVDAFPIALPRSETNRWQLSRVSS
jgi:hypothetical protein